MSTKPSVNEAAVIAFRDAAEFEAWLDGHVDLRAGVWLKIAKKGSGIPSLTDDEAVDLGLCYGWIAGQRKSYDKVYYLQKYVPRRPRSAGRTSMWPRPMAGGPPATSCSATGGNEFQDHRVLSRPHARSFPRYRSSRQAFERDMRLATGLFVGSLYLYGALGNLLGTRGRHPGWMLYALALVLIVFGVNTSGG